MKDKQILVAGGGGFIAVLTRPGYKNACADAAEALGGIVWPFIMDQQGVLAWQEPDWPPAELADLKSLARASCINP